MNAWDSICDANLRVGRSWGVLSVVARVENWTNALHLHHWLTTSSFSTCYYYHCTDWGRGTTEEEDVNVATPSEEQFG